MVRPDDTSGQVMLTSAFLLAIILTLLALVLNNVIYFNNVSYMGFMDHARTDDLSIKDVVTQEAYGTYSEVHGDPSAFNAHMQDLVASLNSVTLPKGTRISLTTSSISPWDPASNYVSTRSTLTINSRDSSKTYTIDTIYGTLVTTPIPTPTPTPAPSDTEDCTVTLVSSSLSLYVTGSDKAMVTARVIRNSDSHPVVGVTVNLSAVRGGFYDASGSTSRNQVVTDSSGTATAYYFPSQAGTDLLNASVGPHPSHSAGNLSGNVSIVNSIFTVCTHTVTIGSPSGVQADHNGNNYWVKITIPVTVPVQSPDFNFSGFTVGAALAAGSTNMQFLSPSDMGNFTVSGYVTGPAAYSRDIVVKLGRPQKSAPYTAVVVVTVTAYCNVDNATYVNTRTITVTGS